MLRSWPRGDEQAARARQRQHLRAGLHVLRAAAPGVLGERMSNSATAPSWPAAKKRLGSPVKASEEIGPRCCTTASFSARSRSHSTMAPPLWPVSARRSSTASAVARRRRARWCAPARPSPCSRRAAWRRLPADTIQRPWSAMRDGDHGTGVTGEARRLGEVGGLARHQAGAAALDLRHLVLVGDGEAGDADADQQLERQRAPLPWRHVPGAHAARSCRRAALQHAGAGSLALAAAAGSCRRPALPSGQASGAGRSPARSCEPRWRQPGGAARALRRLSSAAASDFLRGARMGGRLLLQRLDEIEQLALVLRRIRRRRHQAAADRSAAARLLRRVGR